MTTFLGLGKRLPNLHGVDRPRNRRVMNSQGRDHLWIAGNLLTVFIVLLLVIYRKVLENPDLKLVKCCNTEHDYA
ncbi:unnamed protein product [Caretta caretta]